MKILYETPDGNLIATECSTIEAAWDRCMNWWLVRIRMIPDGGMTSIADNLTEKEAKVIVRKLFDYGVYTHCP